MKSFHWALRACAAVALTALAGTALAARAADPGALFSMHAGIDRSNLDPTCKPCDDFFQYATGGWQKAHPIPAAYAAWGTGNILNDDNENVLRRILEDAANNTAAPAGSNERKIGTYYRACMNEAGIEAAGLSPLQPELDRIDAVTSPAAFLNEVARLGRIGVGVGVAVGAGSDQKDSSKQIAFVTPGGLGLPDRDYYLKDDERFKTARAAYATYLTAVLGYLGEDAAKAASDSQRIIALETTFAQARLPRTELRNPAATYHPTPFASLATAYPGVDWTALFANLGVPAGGTVNVTQPEALKAGIAQLTATPLDTWKAYARFKLIDAYNATLPKKFVDAAFAFRGTALNGVKEQMPRWKRCVTAVDNELGEALGAVYVEKAFPPAAKARALALVNNLQSVLRDDIRGLAWMSPPTKARAEAKLAAFTKKVGYPDKFRDYSALDVKDDSYAANKLRANLFDDAIQVARIGKPTDRTLWGMTPPTVNAYYNPANNEIVFPAGILHPPFFSDQNDDAVNYGGTGAVIGHEMTHGFDDQGRQFDENGNRNDWWTPEDAKAFTARAQCIVDQFNGFEVLPGIHENGSLEQGEAIADLGGLTIAYKAFQRTPQYKAHKKIDGFTPEQRFFLAYAQVWAGQWRDQLASQLATTDPHPMNKFRVIGTLSNMPEFRAAFACAANDKMVRADACRIW